MKRIVLFLIILATAAGATRVSRAEADVVRTIPNAGKIDVNQYIVSGKNTIFEFYADWCGPCREIGPKIEAAVRARNDTVLVRVDLTDPTSEAYQQFKIDAVPSFIMYGPDGKIAKTGIHGVGHFLLPDLIPDEPPSNTWRLVLALVAGALVLVLAVIRGAKDEEATPQKS